MSSNQIKATPTKVGGGKQPRPPYVYPDTAPFFAAAKASLQRLKDSNDEPSFGDVGFVVSAPDETEVSFVQQCSELGTRIATQYWNEYCKAAPRSAAQGIIGVDRRTNPQAKTIRGSIMTCPDILSIRQFVHDLYLAPLYKVGTDENVYQAPSALYCTPHNKKGDKPQWWYVHGPDSARISTEGYTPVALTALTPVKVYLCTVPKDQWDFVKHLTQGNASSSKSTQTSTLLSPKFSTELSREATNCTIEVVLNPGDTIVTFAGAPFKADTNFSDEEASDFGFDESEIPSFYALASTELEAYTPQNINKKAAAWNSILTEGKWRTNQFESYVGWRTVPNLKDEAIPSAPSLGPPLIIQNQNHKETVPQRILEFVEKTIKTTTAAASKPQSTRKTLNFEKMYANMEAEIEKLDMGVWQPTDKDAAAQAMCDLQKDSDSAALKKAARTALRTLSNRIKKAQALEKTQLVELKQKLEQAAKDATSVSLLPKAKRLLGERAKLTNDIQAIQTKAGWARRVALANKLINKAAAHKSKSATWVENQKKNAGVKKESKTGGDSIIDTSSIQIKPFDQLVAELEPEMISGSTIESVFERLRTKIPEYMAFVQMCARTDAKTLLKHLNAETRMLTEALKAFKNGDANQQDAVEFDASKIYACEKEFAKLIQLCSSGSSTQNGSKKSSNGRGGGGGGGGTTMSSLFGPKAKCDGCNVMRKMFAGSDMCKSCYTDGEFYTAITKLEDRSDILRKQYLRGEIEESVYDRYLAISEKMTPLIDQFQASSRGDGYLKIQALMTELDRFLPRKRKRPTMDEEEAMFDDCEDFVVDDSSVGEEEEEEEFSEPTPKKRAKIENGKEEEEVLAVKALRVMHKRPIMPRWHPIVDAYASGDYKRCKSEVDALNSVKCAFKVMVKVNADDTNWTSLPEIYETAESAAKKKKMLWEIVDAVKVESVDF